MRQVWDTIAQFHMLESGDRLLVGVSGGPDSVALLHLLHKRAAQYGINLYVVHVHHMLRPEADEEAQYVENLAKQYGLPFRLYKVDVAEYAELHKVSLEQAGHEVRFRCFLDAKAHWGINKLALGHHRDDRAESVLMHMVQGCGLDGLCAMPPVDVWDTADNSMLVRPFAQVSKDALLAYCAEHNLLYYIDATNLEPDCLRNQIRLELLPQMKQYNPQIAESLVRLQDISGAELDYLTQQTEQLWVQYGSRETNMIQFPADVFREQHIALQRRILRFMYQLWAGSTNNLSFAQIEQMRNISMCSDGTQMVSLFDDIQFVRRYNTLCIKAKAEQTVPAEPVYWDVPVQSVCNIWNGAISIEMNVPYNAKCGKDTVYVDADKVKHQLVIRTRMLGDKITLPGFAGHKSIKKFFIDKKVPKEERDTIPLVISDGEIVWIPGLYTAESIGITEHTKRICKLCFSHV